ncbi:hypothetical protein FIA58_001620 [Flavobacterium jejuense]|uniref:Uncharacterized protein n=1 Tax=Flavobacterium jejuense TaxID=1544455 RepID=A0ABX0IR93_9FLAO|nr:hypothetical protein [Flavobacterium jejuense]NHN24360.1 hypothetical protein [Flavobacterium jejuense]
MKNFLYTVLLFVVGIYAIYEQSKSEPNKFIMFGALAIFMVGLYRISNKIPSKQDKENTEDEQ